MTIRDLIDTFDKNVTIEVVIEIVNPFDKSDVIYQNVYRGELSRVLKIYPSDYMEMHIEEAKLCLGEKGKPFISALMKGLIV